MILREFVHSPAITCSPETTLAEVAVEMDRYNIGSVVVVGRQGEVVGIVTDRDVAVRGMAKGRPGDTPVRDVMTSQVTVLGDDADLFDAAQKMADSGCRRLPVMGADGVLKGLVALDDLMLLFTQQADHLAHAVAAETTSPLPQH